jgi:mannose-1-phosphate guanylyltransferase/mannose-6-phosphate isomerase
MPLISDRSLFLDTVARLQGLPGGQPPVVVAGERHAAAVSSQLADAGIEGVAMIEPEGRDSAPAIAAAVAWIAGQDPEAIVVVTPSDHHVPDAGAFRDAVERAAKAAEGGAVVTFGIRPTGPATAYGYLAPGPVTDAANGVHALERFVEKPDAATAAEYVRAGYLWNSGYFVFRADVFLEELRRHAAGVAEAAWAAVAEAARDGQVVRLGPAFRSAPKISIDYAVMEKTDRAAVIPVDFAWSDLGAWDSVWAASAHDAEGNSVRGDTLLLDSRDCLVRNDTGRLVVGVGLERLAVVAEQDAILICALDASQAIKTAVDTLRADGRPELDIGPAPSAGLGPVRDGLVSWLNTGAFPVWWALGADFEHGGFHEALDFDGRPIAKDKRARVQARQVFSFALAGALGWTGPWKRAVEHGLDFFIERYRRSDGLFRTLVHADGSPADDTAMLYDQAFALFAMAWTARSLPERAERLADQAAGVIARLRETRWDGTGFLEAAGPYAHLSNPHMHLFEAALAWGENGAGGEWDALADQIGELSLHRFMDGSTGALREFFDPAWNPAPGTDGRIVEPGHQFEWAWLMERWGRLRGRDDARAAARRLFEIGVIGVDPARGVAVNALLDDFSPHDRSARLWPQTEWLKSAVILGETAEGAAKARYQASTLAAAQGLKRYFEGLPAGMWRDKLEPNGEFVAEPVTASSLYHIACAISEFVARTKEI